MRKIVWLTLLSATVLVAIPALAASAGKSDGARSVKAAIERALMAAPASVARNAAVVRMDDTGHITRLRDGRNEWTCMPTDPGTPVGYPVCLDRKGFAWFLATMAGKEPDPASVGYSYMLQGGTVWSAVDPAATKLPAGEKKPVAIPPHIMIMNARIAKESGFPSGVAHPDTHQPFVLYGDSPYAILIIPVK